MCLSGLPGVGKTTIARQVARQTGALWLWIDQIETAIKASHMQTNDLADGGYAAAQAVAQGALEQGFDVIADCVNPIGLSRDAWWEVSRKTGARHLDVEIWCSDEAEHRKRVETRSVDLSGWVGPDWQAVQVRRYEPFPAPDFRIDTARTTLWEAVALLSTAIRNETQENGDVRNH
ncbi:MAG: AAA family ATPase [Ruegeria sp.]